ncbi:MAG: hypothetical protein U0599_02850 [Vicinamibacteria bacterium]
MPNIEPSRPRVVAAATLRVAGTGLVVLALLLGYTNRVVYDPDAFAERSALALADPRVSGFVAERIADQVIARKPDLVAVRPVVAGAARTVVASDAFRALFRVACRRAHELAFSRGAESVVLSLPDFAVLLNGALARIDPQVARRLDSSLGVQLGDDVNEALGAGALRFLRAASRLRRFVLLALALGIAALAASVAALGDRRRAIVLAGVALAAAAIVLFAVPALVGAAVSARIEDEPLRQAARGVWDAFAGRLEVWALVLAAMGTVLAAAASSYTSHVEVEAAARGAWRWLVTPSPRPRRELQRGLALVAFGLNAVLRPWEAVRLVAVLLGAGLAFEGLRSLFGLIAPRLDEARDRAQDALQEARTRAPWLRYAATALVVVGSTAAGVSWLGSPSAVPTLAAAFADRCNGSPALCDRPLDQVVLPGAHNAMSAADWPGWMFPNQEVGMAGQLGHGIRALLFDVHNGLPVAGRVKTVLEDEPGSRAKFDKALGPEAVAAAMRIRDRLVGPPEGPKGPYLCHGFCELGARPLADALREIRDFLVANPGEVVFLVIEDYAPPAEIARAFGESGLLDLVYKGPAGPPWPTLRQLVRANERVLVAAENETGGIPWYHAAYEFTQETPYHFESPSEFSCRANRGGDGKSFFLLNHWIDTTPMPKPSNAAIVNQRDYVLARARQCESERGKRPTILAVDFALTGDVVGAAAVMNGTAGPPPAGPTERTR